MKVLLDMGAAVATAGYLRSLGHDAVHLRERCLQRLPDLEVIQLAASESHVVVTFELDFSRAIALTRRVQPSIILFRLETYSTPEINHSLRDILQRHEDSLRSGAIVIVVPGRIRIRLLPIE
jgi:predicted nuclease of predicted toxin-antitoxin system